MFDDRELQARRDRLASNLAKLRKRSKSEEEGGSTSARSGWGLAVKVSSEFIAGITVGAILGFGFDSYFGTSPWGLIVLLMLGFAAGVLNVLRAVGKVAEPPKL
nr:AtpZ/AtpI family protein [Pararhizobium haloflavum]